MHNEKDHHTKANGSLWRKHLRLLWKCEQSPGSAVDRRPLNSIVIWLRAAAAPTLLANNVALPIWGDVDAALIAWAAYCRDAEHADH